MDENKDKIEEVQANEVTETDTEQKDNKKKIIIISSVVASIVIIGLVSWFIVTAIDKGKEFVDNVSDSVNNIAENIPSLDLDITLENETTTELETTTEQPTTEVETEEQSTEVINYDFKQYYEELNFTKGFNTFKGVYKSPYTAYAFEEVNDIYIYVANNGDMYAMYITDKERFDPANPADVGVLIHEESEYQKFMSGQTSSSGSGNDSNTNEFIQDSTQSSQEQQTQASEEEKLARLLEIDKGSYETGYYKDGNTIIYNNRSKDDLVMQTKNTWIKENYRTSFTHNGIEFYWDETNQLYYWIYKYGSIHYMTSTSTSIIGQYYRNFYSFRIADYLGFYGTDYALYHSELALNDEIFMWIDNEVKMTVDNMYETNFAYLKQLEWTEDVEVSREYHLWDFISTEEVPVRISEDGYLCVNIKYPTDTEYQEYKFTIEEYNEFVSSHIWRVSSETWWSGWEWEPQEEWTKYIEKYIIIYEE